MNGENDRPLSAQPPPPVYEYAASDEISLIELINVVLKNRRLVIATPLFVFLLVVGYTFLQPRTFTSSASFMLQASSGQGSLTSSLAAQFGVSLPAEQPGQSPAFYADLLQSREILGPVVDTTYVVASAENQPRAPLSGIFGVADENPARMREKTIAALRARISVSTDRETGVISVSTQTLWPELSRSIVQNLLEHVNRFNLESRQSQATAERVFVEARLKKVEADLREAEDALQDFLQKNRQWNEAPELAFIHDRLQRVVTMRQQIFTTLSQAYEQAQIDEVRDTPVITLVERPEEPAIPDRRRLLLKGILALMVGGMLGVFGAFGREFMVRGRQQEANEFADYERLKRETIQDLRRPWRLLRG